MMYTIDDVEAMLDEICEELPAVFFKHLNGGVLLLEEAKTKREGSGLLYVMGQYHNNNMGRYIYIFYGSFARLYPDATMREIRENLKDVLLHEFTHHLESLAGIRSLEQQDEQDMERFREMHP
ncbi:MAG: metallopeptidase family protein [Eubacteriaceae bacterium]|nr:metallopeptidase family protein [Eubacteriaceae bacterium]